VDFLRKTFLAECCGGPFRLIYPALVSSCLRTGEREFLSLAGSSTKVIVDKLSAAV
jgi:hypothetical protein